jgi:hypothetical protein
VGGRIGAMLPEAGTRSQGGNRRGPRGPGHVVAGRTGLASRAVSRRLLRLGLFLLLVGAVQALLRFLREPRTAPEPVPYRAAAPGPRVAEPQAAAEKAVAKRAPAAKKATPEEAPAKKGPPKAGATKQSPAKKATGKKAATAKKAAPEKGPAKKPTGSTPAKKATGKKAATKQSAAKKAPSGDAPRSDGDGA